MLCIICVTRSVHLCHGSASNAIEIDLSQASPTFVVRHKYDARRPRHYVLRHWKGRPRTVNGSTTFQQFVNYAGGIEEHPCTPTKLDCKPIEHVAVNLMLPLPEIAIRCTHISPYCSASFLAQGPCCDKGICKEFPRTGRPGTRGGSLYFELKDRRETKT